MRGIVMVGMIAVASPVWAGWTIVNDGSCTGARAYVTARAESLFGVGDAGLHRHSLYQYQLSMTGQVRPDDVGVQLFAVRRVTRVSISPVGIMNVPLGLVCQAIRRTGDQPNPPFFRDQANPPAFDDRPDR